MVAWWGSDIECVSALARLEREGNIGLGPIKSAISRLDELRKAWQEIQPVAALRETARRLLRVHKLRAADSLQLAAALLACEGQPSTLDFVCLDRRLELAAEREGLNVISEEAENDPTSARQGID